MADMMSRDGTIGAIESVHKFIKRMVYIKPLKYVRNPHGTVPYCGNTVIEIYDRCISKFNLPIITKHILISFLFLLFILQVQQTKQGT